MENLTQGEKTVWAAVFAHELQFQLEDSRENDENDDEDTYEACVRCGAESGCEAVKALRKETKEGWRGFAPEDVAMIRFVLEDK